MMKAIVMLMLAVQAAIVLVTVVTVLTARPTSGRGRPFWPGLIVSLALIGTVSWQIGEKHHGQPGAEILMWGSPFLLGMAIMAALMVVRRRRGLDG
jgi:4-hydroxybenzoate polyprenyltransferase